MELTGNPDLFTDQYATCLECRIPIKPEIRPVDFTIDGDTCLVIAPWVFHHAAKLYAQLDLLLDALDRQVTPDFITSIIVDSVNSKVRSEMDLLVIFYIKKVRADQMSVPISITGVYCCLLYTSRCV